MRHPIVRTIRRVLLGLAPLLALDSSAVADPLMTFSVADLGPGMTTFGTRADGSGIVIAGNGQSAYPFQNTHDIAVDPQQLLAATFPLSNAAPVNNPLTNGNPAYAYSTLMSPTTNGNGVYVGIDEYGVVGHAGSANAYYVTQTANGTWSAPVPMWNGDGQWMGMQTGTPAITAINKLNEVLGIGSGGTSIYGSHSSTYLYSIATNTLLNLSTLNVLTSAGWFNIQPIALDDRGRILVQADSQTVDPGRWSEHTLLLTPDGVSSTPFELAAPEPSALATGALILVALALRKAVRAQR